MPQDTCIAPDCEAPVGKHGARGFCQKHYAASKPPCSIEGCEKRQLSRGWCSTHVNRWRQTGDPLKTPTGVTHEGNRGACDVEGCDQPKRKRDWCTSHYEQWRATGEVKALAHKWATDRKCVVCGAESPEATGRRKHCSGRCAALDSRHEKARPTESPCVQCGDAIDFLGLTKAGQFRRVDTKLCKACRSARGLRHGRALKVVARNSGTVCNICDAPVDMALTFPDPMRPSVDHVLPWARGGSHDLENLRVAHLHCNQIKSDRIDYKVT